MATVVERHPIRSGAEKVIAHVAKAAVVQVKEVIDATFHTDAIVYSDMARELDQLFQIKRAEWLEDIAGATSMRSQSRLFLAMSDALEGLGY